MLTRRTRRSAILPILAIGLAGCGGRGESAAADTSTKMDGSDRPAAADTTGQQPTGDRAIALRVRGLTESSGAAMSVTQPGVWFTINDSGHDATLFAVDTTGSERGRWVIPGAQNVDWEAVSMGPCGDRLRPSRVESGPMRCVYIGDVGDNDAQRRDVTIYRLREPAADAAGSTNAAKVERLVFRYQEGARDVEAMYVGPNGTIYLVSKRPMSNWANQRQPARTYTLPATAWDSSSAKKPAVARFDQTIPIVPGSAPLRTITDASLAPDGRHVAVRTYGELYLFKASPTTGRIVPSSNPSLCSLVSLDEWQGEGITWFGKSLLLSSERANSPMHIIGCALPP